MYQRCISDNTGLEPRNLFNLVQFLMFDKEFTGRISVENTLQILFVRHGRGELDAEIAQIFEDQQRGSDGRSKNYILAVSCKSRCSPAENEMDEKGGPQSCHLHEAKMNADIVDTGMPLNVA